MRPLLTLVCLASLSAPAAATVSVSINQAVNGNEALWWEVVQTVVLPTGFSNGRITLDTVFADDVAVLEVNGTVVTAFGILGPGPGQFYFTQNGAPTPITASDNGGIGASFLAPLVEGANMIRWIINNNNAGINSGGGPLAAGPTMLDVVGRVEYDGAVVPEAPVWATLIAGFGLVGAVRRRQRRWAAPAA